MCDVVHYFTLPEHLVLYVTDLRISTVLTRLCCFFWWTGTLLDNRLYCTHIAKNRRWSRKVTDCGLHYDIDSDTCIALVCTGDTKAIAPCGWDVYIATANTMIEVERIILWHTGNFKKIVQCFSMLHRYWYLLRKLWDSGLCWCTHIWRPFTFGK